MADVQLTYPRSKVPNKRFLAFGLLNLPGQLDTAEFKETEDPGSRVIETGTPKDRGKKWLVTFARDPNCWRGVTSCVLHVTFLLTGVKDPLLLRSQRLSVTDVLRLGETSITCPDDGFISLSDPRTAGTYTDSPPTLNENAADTYLRNTVIPITGTIAGHDEFDGFWWIDWTTLGAGGNDFSLKVTHANNAPASLTGITIN